MTDTATASRWTLASGWQMRHAITHSCAAAVASPVALVSVDSTLAAVHVQPTSHVHAKVLYCVSVSTWMLSVWLFVLHVLLMLSMHRCACNGDQSVLMEGWVDV